MCEPLEPSDSPDEATAAEAFDALSHPVRWRVVRELSRRGEAVSVELLAALVVGLDGPAGEAARWDGAARFDDADRRRATLHHVHLPQLVKVGFVEWEDGSDAVSLTARFDEGLWHAAQVLAGLAAERRRSPRQ